MTAAPTDTMGGTGCAGGGERPPTGVEGGVRGGVVRPDPADREAVR